ncbi:hypothetical protein [Arthrobacter sp. MYb213]|uniref:hypothetical protein n=1 Tax=Arthrobacter sp. MYb213 TaxID=1848595 RepID=UPI000CFC40CD|nr:hypothetical protein [Arthrobacter sp. MYb213]PRB69523.1 hypothetical protein CQ011_12230 [Arthrobacter sp. MYb213]
MARKPNLNSGSFKKFVKNQGALAVQTPLSRTAVERGSTRWLDGSRVDIEGILNLIGRMNASGVVDVTGTLNGSGTNNFSGTNNLTGINHLVGPTDVAGNFEIISGGQFKAGDSIIYPDGSAKFGALGIASDGTMQAGLFELRPDGSADFGTFGIEADGTLHVRNDLNIEDGGLFKSGVTQIEPTGKATFGDFIIDPDSGFPLQTPGGDMFLPGGGGIGLTSTGFGQMSIMPTGTSISNGTTVLSLFGGVASLLGALKISSTPTAPASELIPLGIDTNGNVKRIV